MKYEYKKNLDLSPSRSTRGFSIKLYYSETTTIVRYSRKTSKPEFMLFVKLRYSSKTITLLLPRGVTKWVIRTLLILLMHRSDNLYISIQKPWFSLPYVPVRRQLKERIMLLEFLYSKLLLALVRANARASANFSRLTYNSNNRLSWFLVSINQMIDDEAALSIA